MSRRLQAQNLSSKTLAPELFTNPLVYPTPDSFKQMHDVVLSSAEDDHKWSTLFTAAMGH